MSKKLSIAKMMEIAEEVHKYGSFERAIGLTDAEIEAIKPKTKPKASKPEHLWGCWCDDCARSYKHLRIL